MKKIETLLEDIDSLLLNKVDELDPVAVGHLKERIGDLVISRLTKPKEEKPRGLRMSNIGSPCERKLWYEVNEKENAEPLRADTLLKFLYGDFVEELILFLAEAAGHSVEGRQETLEIAGIEGHRDAVIDGVTVDVKSANTYGFAKFKNHKLDEDDPFGYRDQLQSYIHAGQTDELVTDKNRGAFLVMDKQLGHLCLDIHDYRPISWENVYEHKKNIVDTKYPPNRTFLPVPEGKSGNTKLDTFCSYCAYKKVCHPGLRTFLYSGGPRFLVNVENEPMVQEVT